MPSIDVSQLRKSNAGELDDARPLSFLEAFLPTIWNISVFRWATDSLIGPSQLKIHQINVTVLYCREFLNRYTRYLKLSKVLDFLDILGRCLPSLI